jgi:uncharacterized OB-fold protein
MALIKCDKCGDLVSDNAAACPKCGAPVIDRVGRELKGQLVYTVLTVVVAIVSGIVTWLIVRHMLQPVLTLPQN